MRRATKRGHACSSMTCTARVPFERDRRWRNVEHVHRRAGDRRDFAGDAGERQAVRAVGRELQRDQRVVKRQRLAQRSPRRERGIEHEQSARVVVDPQFPGRAQHAARFDAAHRRALDFESAGKRRAFQRAWHGHSCRGVGRAADDLQRLAAARIDGANAQPVGVRVRRDLVDSAPRRRAQTAVRRAWWPRPPDPTSSAGRTTTSVGSGGSHSVRSQSSENFIAAG